MGMGTFTCQMCHKRFKGTPRRTFTGRQVCSNCEASLEAVVVSRAMGQNLPETIATVGWLQRIRAARGKRSWPGEDR